ncbi:ECF transporter S component [Sinanaerobacter chloroacetimidivorans]|uniref:ECF transporter S component n=1 Tax=Sinanaerobacter chloroacetimidivorans TaxID=2818044 RepID=A0A8J7W2M9_9FIRM|nr:ECF transporter S component [Sinanaerobacter chloroacetimidivorans]MBR0598273.1 ECF transporter S component [Sinanaerobacter chloroacetimidivorans]
MQSELNEKSGLRKRTLAAAFMILIMIPAAIFFGMYFLDDRKYYVVSLVIICLTMVPFFMVFEDRKPQARELILIAVLIAIAVAGRAAFFMLPQFKPVVAIVIISGVCLGGEVGFLVGAMTGFISNFFFGQGPWTPWQMFCFGIIGFLAGVLFQKGLLKKNRLQLCIFGGLAAFFIYGGIIDIWTILMFTPDPAWETAALVYGTGFWFNLIHAVATVIFLFFLANPMIEKLERIKIKYGLVE